MDEVKKQEVRRLNTQIGGRLKEIRENNGYTQEEFAETLNISVVHYRKLESGIYRLQNEYIVKLYRAYHIDPTFLLTGEHKEKPNMDMFLMNCTPEQREENLDRMFAYIRDLLRHKS